jgi:Type II secretion system (T2SS), protein N
MPVSRSPSRDARPRGRDPRPSDRDPKISRHTRSYWPVILIGLVAVLAVIIAALPASIIAHFLPPEVHAEDFSGSIWHGSAGKISVIARDAGALEWRLHPAALLGMQVSADVHWVKVGFVVDAAVNVDRLGLTAHAVKGGGPIEDLRDFGVAAGWRGMANINFSELKSDWVKPLAAVGDIQASNLTSAQIAQGVDLGGYDLRLAEGAIGTDGSVTTQLTDTGGPLDVKAVIHLSAKERTGTLTGTLKERPEAPAALRSDLEGIVQLRGRDQQGRIPVDLEFTW